MASWSELSRRARSVARRRRSGAASAVAAAPQDAPARQRGSGGYGYDSWLRALHGERLAAIDAACRDGGPGRLALFRALDPDLWALLLTQEQAAYPNIAALLPGVPDAGLQEIWNGASGAALAAQGASFYRRLVQRHAEHGDLPLERARVLDFGCGWGRLTRMIARDVRPGMLFGCDPVDAILDVCRECGVPATLARSDFVPEALPFGERFDLAFAFSVFTHLSEPAHERCLRALHASLRPGAILVVTVRPPAFVALCAPLRDALGSLGPDPDRRLEQPLYLFVAHGAEAGHPQYAGGAMTYGDTVVTLPYVRERWSELFELLEVDLLLDDLHQVMLTLRRR